MSTLSLARDPAVQASSRPRRHSLDVVRGLAVLGMLLVNNAGVDGALPAQLRHSQPGGLHVADLVFPLFLFVAGVGTGLVREPAPVRRVLRRCAVLFALGCLLVSAKYQHLSVSTGVLQHIAIATLVAYAVLRAPRRMQGRLAAAGLLLAWALPTYVEVRGTVAGSWAQSTTLSAAVERIVTGHTGKQQVVAAVVSGLTVLGGVWAGRTLRAHPGPAAVRRLLLASLASTVLGLLLAPSVPLDETLWTPSYLLVTGGVCGALLAVAVVLVDLRGWHPAAHPLRVLGANAIAVYVVTTLLYSGLLAPVRDELVWPLRLAVGDRPAALAYALSSAVVGWALAEALWRRRLLLKV